MRRRNSAWPTRAATTATAVGWPEATVRLAELRRRQGRIGEALELFASRSKATHFATEGMAEIALDRCDAVRARHLAEQLLRRVPATARTEHAAGPAPPGPVTRPRSATLEGAAEAIAELEVLVASIGTLPLRAPPRTRCAGLLSREAISRRRRGAAWSSG